MHWMMNLLTQCCREARDARGALCPAMCIPHHSLSITYYKTFSNVAAVLIVYEDIGPGLSYMHIIALSINKGSFPALGSFFTVFEVFL